MTISASDDAAAGKPPDGVQALYRDLSGALRGQLVQMKAGTGGDASDKASEEALRARLRMLRSVLDVEASRVERTNARAPGASGELDLDAARAEILARLAHWVAEG